MPNSNKRYIGLITDFGDKGLHYVASMKAVILKINPNVEIIDVNHHISPFNVYEASFLISTIYKYFPERAIFIIVVDPGVGTSREILAIHLNSDYYFIGPNNGIFTLLLKKKIKKCIRIENNEYYLKPVSKTFHGRDIMAPVGAYISKDINLEKLGPQCNLEKIHTYTFEYEISLKNKNIRGQIIYVDQFGNCITNISVEKGKIDGSSLSLKDEELINLILKDKTYKVKFVSHYDSVPLKSIMLLEGSYGNLEISINQGNAANELGLKSGDKIQIKI